MRNLQNYEVKWTDDAIRWEGGLNGETAPQPTEDSDEDGCMVDPFSDPDPFELQTFRFNLPSAFGAARDSSEITVVINGYKTTADAVWKSTGLTLWKASGYLCQYQCENAHELFSNKRVLELGAGLGLNGILGWKIMCSLRGSGAEVQGSVCITDGDSDALVHLRENIQRNHTEQTTPDNIKVYCNQLLWGEQTSNTFLEQIAQNKKYHTVLASDIIYAPSIIEPLWETVETLLESRENGGAFVMAFARRKVPVSIDMLLEAAKAHGFECELVKEDQDEGIWVYVFRFM
jgi:predicted nicotinamide N-methyase